jgi:hypothetical protein
MEGRAMVAAPAAREFKKLRRLDSGGGSCRFIKNVLRIK